MRTDQLIPPREVKALRGTKSIRTQLQRSRNSLLNEREHIPTGLKAIRLNAASSHLSLINKSERGRLANFHISQRERGHRKVPSVQQALMNSRKLGEKASLHVDCFQFGTSTATRRSHSVYKRTQTPRKGLPCCSADPTARWKKKVSVMRNIAPGYNFVNV